MKFINKIFAGIAVLSLAASTVGCSDDTSNWTPKDEAEAPAVYFKQGNPNDTISVTASDSVYLFNIYRLTESAPSTVLLSWSGDTDKFTLPGEVNFQPGALMQVLAIEFDINDLVLNEPYDLKVEIVDGYETTQFSSNYINFNITYVPFSNWAPFGYNEALGIDGSGEFTFDFMLEGVEDVRVLSRYNLENDSIQEYQFQWALVDNPDLENDDDWETFLFANTEDGGETVIVPEQQLGDLEYPGYGAILVQDTETASSLYPSIAANIEVQKTYFNSSNGTFYFSLFYSVPTGNYFTGCGNYETCAIKGWEDTSDYNLYLTNNGQVSIGGTNYQIINFNWVSLEYAEYVNVETSSISEDGIISEELVDNLISDIKDGNVSGVNKVSTPGNVTFSFDADGEYTIVAIGYTSDEEAMSSAYVSYEYEASVDPNEGWTSLGYVDYTDGYICSFYIGVPAATYSVELQESDETPGLYRLVNPYGAAYPYNEPGDYNESVNSYLLIDATDTDKVYVQESPQTLDWGDGTFICYSYAGYYLEYRGDAASAEEGYGTLENEQITFPAEELAIIYGSYIYPANFLWDDDTLDSDDPDEWDYVYNVDGTVYAPFCVDMSTLSSASQAASKNARAKATAQKYRKQIDRAMITRATKHFGPLKSVMSSGYKVVNAKVGKTVTKGRRNVIQGRIPMGF